MKKVILPTVLVLVVLLYSVGKANSKSDNYLQINKAFEIYGNAVKGILNNYIDAIPIDVLMTKSIEGMLGKLDPYAEYFSENDSNEIEFITDGNYIGFGFSVMLIDSMLTIVRIRDNTPAYNAGLRVGDIIYSIDNQIVINNGDIHEFTRNSQSGVKSDFCILRIKNSYSYAASIFYDTLNYNIRRELLHLPSVTTTTVLPGSIGYIKIERFSRKCANEFLAAYNTLKQNDSITALIIDLRGNPGGVLSEAVEICEMFVPIGSKIVSIRGRHEYFSDEYISQKEPIDTTQPIAILIDSSSASASEILAGALQDLDRAVIIGHTSFGKGLVQRVINLSDNTALKLTTAKYYTPSGRCLQKINYSSDAVDSSKNSTPVLADTSIFFTRNGRKVFELNGIKPDMEIKAEKNTSTIDILSNYMLFFKFANMYCAEIEKNRFDFELTDDVYSRFVNFATTKNTINKLKTIKQLENILDSKAFSNSTELAINNLIATMQDDLKNNLLTDRVSKKQALKILDLEIKLRFYTEKSVQEDQLLSDEYIAKTSEIFKNGSYQQMLVGTNTNISTTTKRK